MARVIIGISALLATAHAAGLHYKPHDPVFVVANKVGPFNNPSETYEVSYATPLAAAHRMVTSYATRRAVAHPGTVQVPVLPAVLAISQVAAPPPLHRPPTPGLALGCA